MTSKNRLDKEMVNRRLVPTRSQAESHIRLGSVSINGREIKKPGFPVGPGDKIEFKVSSQYVSRAGIKLASAALALDLDFRSKIVLDVGSSTGGFTDYCLQNGATKIIAIDVGTNQMHPDLRGDSRVELHEQTDIRMIDKLSAQPDYVLIDVSFISLREILPAVHKLASEAQIVAMVKPQFESADKYKHKGVVKNEKMRREILKDFEAWAKADFKILAKADSSVAGEKGNLERFYLLRALSQK